MAPSAPPILPGDKGYAFNKYKKGTAGKPPSAPSAPSGEFGGGGGGTPPGLEEAAGDVDSIMNELGLGAEGDGGEGIPGEITSGIPGEEGEGAERSPGDILAQALEIDPAKGQALYDAAQQREDLAGVPPEELATILGDDVNLRMDLERIAGTTKDQSAYDDMDDFGMGEDASADDADGAL